MLQKKTSVLIVTEGESPDQKIQIPTFLITHWKRIFLAFSFVLALSITSVVYYVKQREHQVYQEVYIKKLDKLKAENRQLVIEEEAKQVDIEEVRKSIHTFDSTLNRINEKMRKRGLKAMATPNAGGPVEASTEEDLEELAKFYTRSLMELEKRLDGAPFGRPHAGRITSRYGYRRNPFTGRGREMHSGVDLKGRRGEAVKTTATGRVTYAGYMGAYGNVVMVKHNNGYETRYAHLSRLKVRKGQYVEVGTIIGLLGSTGRSTGPHLHYEVMKGGKKLNPEKYFSF